MKRFLMTDFEEEESGDLYALHSSIESYLLAFKLNQQLGIQLKNVTEEIKPESAQPIFNRFLWASSTNGPSWELIANHFVYSKKESEKERNTLFTFEEEAKSTLIKELYQVNYFLKVPPNSIDTTTLKTIQSIDEIQLIYAIENQAIKKNPNLIFD